MDYSHIDSTRNLNSTLFKNKFRKALCSILLELEHRLKKEGTTDVHILSNHTDLEKYSEDEKRKRELINFEREKLLKSFKVQVLESWLEKTPVETVKSPEKCTGESLVLYLCYNSPLVSHNESYNSDVYHHMVNESTSTFVTSIEAIFSRCTAIDEINTIYTISICSPNYSNITRFSVMMVLMGKGQ